MTRTGGAIVSRAIQRQGVGTVFALAGAGHVRLLEALDADGVHIVSSRHESACVAAADGYARITGNVGFALVIIKQGLSNTVGGLSSAWEACSPVVVLVARHPLSHDDPGSQDDEDELALVRPITKWARAVHSADRLAEYLHTACHQALSGRPGPVVLSIPTDLLAEKVDDIDEEPIVRPLVPEPSVVGVEDAAALIASAERPLVVIGSGGARAGAGVRRLAETYRLPVMGHALGRGVVPEDLVTGFPWSLAQVSAKEADVVLTLGARLSDRLGFGLAPRFSADARFIQVDVRAEELRRARTIDVPIVGDVEQTAIRIAEALGRRGYEPVGDPTWVNDAMADRLGRISELGHGDDGPLHPYRIARELASMLPSDAIVVGDGADALNWFLAHLRINQAPGYMDHYPHGSMGIGTPLAVGAAAAAREIAEREGTARRPVILVSGDGSFGFYTAELSSLALNNLPVTAIIVNDRAWGTEYHGQQKLLGHAVNTELGATRFDLVAQGFGCAGEHIDSPTEVRSVLERALASGRPTVVDCWTDRDAGMVRKQDPRIQMIPHDDITTNKRPHAMPSIA